MTARAAAEDPTLVIERKTILIVDDDFDIRDALKDILVYEGYQVAAAPDGLEALTYLRHHAAPGLILLDWMMPVCDGSQFRTEQLRDPQLASIPVVLLTADVRVEEKLSTLALDRGLSKPVELDDLLDIVKHYCG